MTRVRAPHHARVKIGDRDRQGEPAPLLTGGLLSPGACTGGSRLWFPGLRLAFQKGHLAAQSWWAQVGSNHRLLACKAEYGKEYAQLSGPVHAAELRKPCPEMPWGAWESLHGGSRKWFPEQSVDLSLLERVGPGGRATGVAPAG